MNIIDKNNLLDQYQMSLLQQNAQKGFKLAQYGSLDAILKRLKVDVIIEPGIVKRTVPSYLEEVENYWRVEADRLERGIRGNESLYDEYRKARDKRDMAREESRNWSTMSLRGLYDPNANVIKLFPEEMATEYNGGRVDELLVSTLAHETMHAYFDRTVARKKMPYVIFVEEPLAEFGMLLYLYETGSKYYNWAYKDVSSKKTCYRYGATLMDKHLSENGPYPTRQYLEEYKINIDIYAMPEVGNSNTSIELPKKEVAVKGSRTVSVNGKTEVWKDLFKCPPRFFWDDATKTLGLDGDWVDDKFHRQRIPMHIRFHPHLHSHEVQNIYLGSNFTADQKFCHVYNILSCANVIVAPDNKLLKSINGIPVWKNNNMPALRGCGDGYYEIQRNRKWGVIDKNLNVIIPCKYGCVWSFDENDLIEVCYYDRHPYLYGCVNKQGREQIPVIYENISRNSDGTYKVKKGGIEYNIDKDGNRI